MENRMNTPDVPRLSLHKNDLFAVTELVETGRLWKAKAASKPSCAEFTKTAARFGLLSRVKATRPSPFTNTNIFKAFVFQIFIFNLTPQT